jgi:hypothetical protein
MPTFKINVLIKFFVYSTCFEHHVFIIRKAILYMVFILFVVRLHASRKQLIWYGHVERMDPMRLSKIMINWKPEGRKELGRPRRTWKDGIYTAMSKKVSE